MRAFRTAATALLVGLTLVSAGSASAAWMIGGSGDGATKAASLVAPVLSASRSTTAPTSAIDLSWTASSQPATTSYEVRRNGVVIACAGSPCTDSALAPGTAYDYTVTARLGSWSKLSNTASATTQAPSTGTALTVTAAPVSLTAGGTTTVTLTAKRPDGSTDTAFAGSKQVTVGGAAVDSSPGGDRATFPAGSSVSFTNGVSAPVPVRLVRAGASLQLTGAVDGTTLSGATTVTVSPAAPARLAFMGLTWSGASPGDVDKAGCVYGCTISKLGNGGRIQTRVSVADAFGNVVGSLAAPVTVSLKSTGGLLSPSSSITVPASGPLGATSETVSLQEGNANYFTTLTVDSSQYGQLQVTIAKN